MSTEREDGEPVKTILLAGATGNLGGQIARALLSKGAKLRLLVRPGSRAKLAADVAEASEIVENEAGAFDGVYTVVSAVQGGPETIVDAQLNLLRAARAAGVRRFIPSDYSLNLFGLAEGENVRLLSKICGRLEVREDRRGHGRARVRCRDRFGTRRRFWW